MNFNSDTDVRACDNIREELQEYIQSQYSNAVTICTLLETFREEILPDANTHSAKVDGKFTQSGMPRTDHTIQNLWHTVEIAW